jgi:ribosome maturation factor RimP
VSSEDEAVSVREDRLEAVRGAVEPAVRALGFDLYDLELVGGASPTLRVTVTREGGVDLDAITEVTRAVSPVVDHADVPGGSYVLEVSSPGLERALRRPEHFRGAVGEQVSIKVRAGGATRRLHGVLVDAAADRVVVETDAGTREEIAVDDVTQARTVFAWGPQPRSGKKQRGEAIA